MAIINDKEYLYIQNKKIAIKDIAFCEVETDYKTNVKEDIYFDPIKVAAYESSKLYRETFNNDAILGTISFFNKYSEDINAVNLVINLNNNKEIKINILKGKRLKQRNIDKAIKLGEEIIEQIEEKIEEYENADANYEEHEIKETIKRSIWKIEDNNLIINNEKKSLKSIGDLYIEIIGELYFDDGDDVYEDEFDDDIYYSGDIIDGMLEGCNKQKDLGIKGHKSFDYHVNVNINLEYKNGTTKEFKVLKEIDYRDKNFNNYMKELQSLLDTIDEIKSAL